MVPAQHCPTNQGYQAGLGFYRVLWHHLQLKPIWDSQHRGTPLWKHDGWWQWNQAELQMILWDSLAHWHCTSYIEAAGLPSQGLLYLCHCKALFTHVRKLKKPIPGKSAFFTGAICRCMKGISDKQFSEARKCDKDVLNMPPINCYNQY